MHGIIVHPLTASEKLMTNHTRPPNVEVRIERVLAAISSVAAAPNVQVAWSNISAAVQLAEQAESKPWKIDPLTAEKVTNFADGSVRVPQIGHWLYINANGAFGTMDLWSHDFIVVKTGADGVGFYQPIQ